jgi:hypothetical protein
MGYETTWKSRVVRKSASAGHSYAPWRHTIPYGGAEIESVPEFGGTVVSSLSQERQERNLPPRPLGATIPFSPSSERKVEEKTSPRSCHSRILHRLVDAPAYRTNDSIRFRSSVYACRRMENVTPRFRMELSKAGTASLATGRKGHSILEIQDVATYKKKPKNLRRISCLSMKADSCSYPMSVKRGLPQDVRRYSDIAISMRRFRSLAVFPCRPTAIGLACMSDFMPIISTAPMLPFSCGTCCGICASMWFWFWIMALSINDVTSVISFVKFDDFTSIGCQVMRRK